MKTVSIDIETYSPVDLKKSGVYKYAEHPEFEILLIGYSLADDLVCMADVPKVGKKNLLGFISLLQDPTILKTAFNANFERTCLSKFFGIELPPEQWECTMVKSAMLGLPLQLETAAKVLKLEQQKDSAGKSLINYFSKPCKPTKANGGRTRNLPEHAPEKWEAFKEYCRQDIVTEMAIRNKIDFFNILESEKALWCLDQRVNDGGILLDPVFIDAAIDMSARNTERLTAEAISLTGLNNPNSAAQLKDWLSAATGEEITSLTKAAIPEILKSVTDENVSRVLTIRQEMAKTSVKKYQAMQNCICSDNRVRGLLQFYGANRTGRWAGRLVQVQNLPQNKMESLEVARSFVRSGDIEGIELLYGNVPDTLSQLVRTAFIAPENTTFVVADFSAIEARVIAWVAQEKWRLDVFNTHGKIYEASASQMFKVPLEQVTKGSSLRQKGKVAELALGYQGGANALITMGALNQGLTEDELPALVSAWRNANPAIVKLWYEVEEAAIGCVRDGITTPAAKGKIVFSMRKGMLVCHLPSGRELVYQKPRLKPGKFGGDNLVYQGMDQTTKQWKQQDTYGGKLVENIVQAIARDCLAVAITRLHAHGFKIVMHVHDEVVIEEREDSPRIEEINAIMSEPIPWAKGLPLTADSYTTKFYRKD